MRAIPFAHGVGEMDPIKWNIMHADISAQNLDIKFGLGSNNHFLNTFDMLAPYWSQVFITIGAHFI